MPFLDKLQPHLNEVIADLMGQGYTPQELIKPLSNPSFWWMDSMYSKIKFTYDSAELTLVGWLSAAEIMGQDINLDLMERISGTIEYQWEIRKSELQEDLNREHQQVLEGVA